MLAHVNSFLGTSFDQKITTIISDTMQDYAHMQSYIFQTHEHAAFARNDNGHEIAHIVSIYEWGRPSLAALEEGLATASENHGGITAIGSYINRYKWRPDFAYFIDTTLSRLSHNFRNSRFSYSYDEYQIAGAFVQSLISTYGINHIKKWWITTLLNDTEYYNSISEDEIFQSVYNISIDSAIARLRDTLTVRPYPVY